MNNYDDAVKALEKILASENSTEEKKQIKSLIERLEQEINVSKRKH